MELGTTEDQVTMRDCIGPGMSNGTLGPVFEGMRESAGRMTVLEARENGMRVSDRVKSGSGEMVTRMIACYAGGKSDA